MFKKLLSTTHKKWLPAAGTSVLLSITPITFAQTIVEETFDGNLGIFSGSGRVSTSGFDALLRGGDNSSITSNAINLSGFENITISYDRRTSGLDLFESFSTQYAINGGAFTTIESERSASGNFSITLPSSADQQSLSLRFILDASSYFEYLEVDNVVVTGTATGSSGGGNGGGDDTVLPAVESIEINGPFITTEDRNTGPDGDAWVVRASNLGQDGTLHPIFLWGPGGGTGPEDYDFFLDRVASHGFVVFSTVSSGQGTEMRAGLDWLIAQNNSPSSPYYQKLDTTRVAAGGHSLGSITTFAIADDPRLSTTIHVAGGSFDGNGYQSLRNPTAYIAGADDTIATSNVIRDFENTNNVPVFFTNLDDTDHILATRNGQAAIVAWLRWHLAEEEFRSADFLTPGTCYFCPAPYNTQIKNW